MAPQASAQGNIFKASFSDIFP
jgi:signal transduction histidine kinase